MWLCARHPDTNKEQMDKFAQQLRSKSGINLVFTVKTKQGYAELGIPSRIQAQELMPNVENNPPVLESSDVIPNVSTHSYCSKPDHGIKRAVRKMHRFNKKSNPGVETISPPEGSPLFMFQPLEGLSSPINAFYDCGCSDAIFLDGVPGNNLRGALLYKGPPLTWVE